MRIGYLASRYPAVSHTFVLREIRALRRAGVEIETFSIHRTPPGELLADVDRQEAGRTYNVLPARIMDLVTSHLMAFARSPRAYAATLGVRRSPGDARAPRQALGAVLLRRGDGRLASRAPGAASVTCTRSSPTGRVTSPCS